MYTIFTADNINTTTRLTLDEADGFYIKAGVTVANTVGTAIGGATASFVNGVIDGTLSGAFWGILLEGSGSKFSVGKTGVVFGSEAFDLRGHGLSVENEGRILGDFGIHFEIDAPSLKPSQIINSGYIGGSRAIVHGDVNGGGGDMITLNTGTISGTNYAYISVSNEDTVDTIVNRGDMMGEISLFHGNDIYRGGKGSLIGEIFGGDGNDRINCGDDDDLIHGGNGKDRLRGGAGEDVFYFDTSINGFSNVDRILDFSIADDMIGINALTFGPVDISALGGMFAVNKTGKADADDIVIYQSTTGKLFFDHDSKGGDDAVLFAILGKNLKLTADNFEVV